MERWAYAKGFYAARGVDAEAALEKLSDVSISMHCWQGDDIGGFENRGGPAGGIAVTGNYPGRASTPGELMADMDMAFSLIPGRHRINLHAIYAVTDNGKPVERDKLEPAHFKRWVDFARERGLGIDFNPTLFSHEKAADGLTLSHPDAGIRQFWVDHCKATRKIAAYFGESLKTPSLHNIWAPDGYKDTPADRLSPRARLKESLDEIYSVKYAPSLIADSVESKLFGIGVESYTVGSHEFYMNYALRSHHVMCLLDSGHFHPTETISDKISAMLLFSERLALHVTRCIRWDSDHVVAFDDELKAIALAVCSCNALERVLIGLDYFDATINRVAAWVIGMRNMQKALLFALLTPHEKLSSLQLNGDFTGLITMLEEIKLYPLGDVWDAFCERHSVPLRDEWLEKVRAYEKKNQRS